MANWVVSDVACDSQTTTCHYTCNAAPECHASIRPKFESDAALGTFYRIDAPTGGFKTLALLFSRVALQAQCQSDSPTTYCYSIANLNLVGSGCTSAIPQLEPSMEVSTNVLGIFETANNCVIMPGPWFDQSETNKQIAYKSGYYAVRAPENHTICSKMVQGGFCYVGSPDGLRNWTALSEYM